MEDITSAVTEPLGISGEDDAQSAVAKPLGFLGQVDAQLFWSTLILVSGITLWVIFGADNFSKSMSAAFFVGMIISGGELEPSTPIKLIFGFLIGSITVVLLITGGLKALQTASIVAALPFMFVMIGMMISTIILLKKEKR